MFGVPGPLADAIKSFEELTGVVPNCGGVHESLGTHNAVVALGEGAYFEILCRDPAQPSPPRLWMGMESLGTSPTMLTWAADRACELAEAVSSARAKGYDPGHAEDFQRMKPDGSLLQWSLAYRHYTRAQMGAGSGIVPFLIDWKGSVSPAATAPVGCELVELRAEAVDVPAVGQHLRALGIDPADINLKEGVADRLVAVLRTPNGIVEFS